MTNLAETRVLSTDLLAESLSGGDGILQVRETCLGEVSGLEVGLWEAGPGRDVDTEVDEVFLVLAGAGHVEFEDGSRIELRPGVLVRLRSGDQTTWVIAERLRKLYLA